MTSPAEGDAPPPVTAGDVLDAVLREPFEPFLLRTAAGESLAVLDPGDATFSATTACVREGLSSYRSVRFADVAAIELLPNRTILDQPVRRDRISSLPPGWIFGLRIAAATLVPLWLAAPLLMGFIAVADAMNPEWLVVWFWILAFGFPLVLGAVAAPLPQPWLWRIPAAIAYVMVESGLMSAWLLLLEYLEVIGGL
ncbi:hypothetical protein [Alienimonas chondri]|uniref:DUF1353 domain-containing protein n=1 Tax=Alienimonas chondri TaxID=2681879 RepID=A0ABX1V7X9_9PLAN|nr:hypothetical protein [Alienimonas chondri]NNJ23988.1 hypothetical protein [Alienimonas chondri]